MKIHLHDGKPASEETTQALEVALGCRLSDSFRAFLRDHDGAKPEANVFEINDKDQCGVNRFIPAAEIWKERSHIENIPSKAYPVAWAECGNFIFVDEGRNGAVFFGTMNCPRKPLN